MLRLGRQDIDIAAGHRDYVNADTYTLPVDVDALAVQPHAHFLAKEVRAWATLPGGAIVPLIYIKDWNFHWQDVYTYAQPRRAAERNRHRDALHVRQLDGESRESESASQACDVRSDQRVGNGLVVAAGRAATSQRISRASSRTSGRRFCATTSQATRSGSRSSRAMRNCAPSLPRVISRRIDPADALMQLNEAARLDPTAGRHYDVGRVLLIQQDYGARGKRRFKTRSR